MALALEFVISQLFVTLPYPKQDFTGKTVIVTGSNVGLGLEAARHFTRLNAAKVILGVRDLGKGDDARRSIEESTKRVNVVDVWQLDLASYDSVEKFASKVQGLDRLDVVVENAGIATGTYRTAEDNEATITVNVVSTFLLALLVLPKLQESATRFHEQPHLAIVSSEVHSYTQMPEKSSTNIIEKLNDKETARMADRYYVSKLLEVFFCRELAKRSRESGKPFVVINFLNPGLCHSQLGRELGWDLRILKFLFARTTEAGSRTLVAAAVAGEGSHGQYQSNCRNANPSTLVRSDEGARVQKKIYEELSEKLHKIHPGIMNNI